MIPDFPMCCICGFPPIAVTIIRVTWLDESTDEGGFKMRMVVVKDNPENNDSLICVECIRQIKRLNFSDIDAGIVVVDADRSSRSGLSDEPDLPF